MLKAKRIIHSVEWYKRYYQMFCRLTGCKEKPIKGDGGEKRGT